jgi:phosphoribosyl-ATP pyrophosphohydrolase/phosphoribosyl-AMP cyclohydrolase
MQTMVDKIIYNADGLVPAIAQDAVTGRVLMQAYMNAEAVLKTMQTHYAHYYSRSRKQLWKKGEISGNVQEVISFALDCDCDCVLLQVRQVGPACHTGKKSCFFNLVEEWEKMTDASILYDLYNLIADRKQNPKEGSYTNYLFTNGIDKILKKVGEESTEVIIASKNPGTEELRFEVADLLYHLLVLMNEKGLTLQDLFGELESRR